MCYTKKDNIASKDIWQKFNAEFQEDHERVYPKLVLDFDEEQVGCSSLVFLLN